MSEWHIPQTSDEITLRHHIAYYTFLPLVGVLVLSIVGSPVAWFFDYISLPVALALPWVFMGITLIYISYLGDYIIPAETYRKVKSGEWDNYE